MSLQIDQAVKQCIGLTDLLPGSEISLRVQPSSARSGNDSALAGVCLQFRQRAHLSMSGFDQTVGQSFEGSLPSSSDPTSRPSDYPCRRFWSCTSSFTTLLLLTQNLMCCIDRLNPPPLANIEHCQYLRRSLSCPSLPSNGNTH